MTYTIEELAGLIDAWDRRDGLRLKDWLVREQLLLFADPSVSRHQIVTMAHAELVSAGLYRKAMGCGSFSWQGEVVPAKEKGPAEDAIRAECQRLADVLCEKNRKYGNSALEPIRLFSKADPVEQIKVRLDDKLSRLRSGQEDEDEDVEQDIMGYLMLLRIARRGE